MTIPQAERTGYHIESLTFVETSNMGSWVKISLFWEVGWGARTYDNVFLYCISWWRSEIANGHSRIKGFTTNVS